MRCGMQHASCASAGSYRSSPTTALRNVLRELRNFVVLHLFCLRWLVPRRRSGSRAARSAYEVQGPFWGLGVMSRATRCILNPVLLEQIRSRTPAPSRSPEVVRAVVSCSSSHRRADGLKPCQVCRVCLMMARSCLRQTHDLL